ncbi:MAG: 3-phosphoshikimate 1-carboxyvinyltransferase, partial [Firmicutes bacterium]|nr:3-phosphoshikimate 1-carboxyvinyltransferase [Bacillota bacterium]
MIIITYPPAEFRGTVRPPGDKSISHRAVIIAALARGRSKIKGFLDSQDCQATVNCLKALGVNITREGELLVVEGREMGLDPPKRRLNAGNSGTTARLLLGVLAGQPFPTVLTGDRFLRRRPMERVVEPLRQMGAIIEGKGTGSVLPVTIKGAILKPLQYRLPVASAQVKSALLLAGLYPTEGITIVEEPRPSRDHSEIMLQQFGVRVETAGGRIAIAGGQVPEATSLQVPGDISSAAFIMVAASIIPGAEVTLTGVGVNPTRRGIIDLLIEMGAAIEIKNLRNWGGEPVADILVRGGRPLRGITVGGDIIPKVIDELPVLTVAAAMAEGKTEIRDASELRVKESDRIAALV